MNDNYYEGYIHFVRPDEPVNEKLFFNLHIYALHQGNSFYLSFEKNGQQQLIADRVLPGETLLDAVSKELKTDFNINDWEFFGDTLYADTATDNKGKKIKRVDVYVAVPYFDVTNKQVIGMDMYWQLVADEATEQSVLTEGEMPALDRRQFYNQLVDAINSQRAAMGVARDAACKLTIVWDSEVIDQDLLSRDYGQATQYPTSEDLMYDTRCSELAIYYENPIAEWFMQESKVITIDNVTVAFKLSENKLETRTDIKGIREELIFPAYKQ